MIRVSVIRDGRGGVTRVDFTGHAGHDVKGRDIVCAAVSVLAQLAAVGLVEVLGLGDRIDLSVTQGELRLELPSGAELSREQYEKASFLLECVVKALEAIENEYPSRLHVDQRRAGVET